MLFHDFGKPDCFSLDGDGVGQFHGHETLSAKIARTRLSALKFDNDTIRTVTELIRYHDERLTAKSAAQWLSRLGEVRLRQLLEVQRADADAHIDAYRDRRRDDIARVSSALDGIIASGQCDVFEPLRTTREPHANRTPAREKW
jgi:tRNA nucleotidyltransferase (CCA-adding enzyme)